MRLNGKKLVVSRKEWETIWAKFSSTNPIKFAQFESEGKDPLESPDRDHMEMAHDYNDQKTQPPFDLPALAEAIKPLGVINSKIVSNGMELTVEFSDGKLYTVTLSPKVS